MNTDCMPVVFASHGSPMNAIGDNDLARRELSSMSMASYIFG